MRATTFLMAAAMGVLAMVGGASTTVQALQAVPVAVPSAGAGASGAPFVRVPYHSCADGKTLLSEASLTASSWPPQVGVDTVLQLSGTLLGDVTAGTYSISANYLGQQLTESTGDIGTFVDLPASSGDLTVATTLSLPSGTAPGPYSLQLELDSQAGETISCVAIKFLVARERPSVLPAPASDASSEVKVLEPLFDSALEKIRADAAAESIRFEQATRVADALNGDIAVPTITLAVERAGAKTTGAVHVIAAQKSA